MAMTMTQFLTLADRDLEMVRLEEELEYDELYSQILNVRSADKLYLRDAKMAGFGPFQVIPEGDNIPYDEAIAPVTRRYDFQKRGLGYKITDKLWKFDEYDKVMELERALARADRDDTEVYFHAIFNNATNTTISSGFDSLSLANTAHTRLDGGATFQNRPTTFTALSLTALEDAAIAFTKFVDDRGRPYRSMPKTLLIGLDQPLVANEILASAMRPDTANNATNAVRNVFDIDVVVSPYITSDTFAALIGDRHDLNAVWVMRSEQKSKVDEENDVIMRNSRKWMGRGHGEPRGYYQINS